MLREGGIWGFSMGTGCVWSELVTGPQPGLAPVMMLAFGATVTSGPRYISMLGQAGGLGQLSPKAVFLASSLWSCESRL